MWAKAEAHWNEGGGEGEGEAPLPLGARASRRPQVGASNGPPAQPRWSVSLFVCGRPGALCKAGGRFAYAPTPCAPVCAGSEVDQESEWLGDACRGPAPPPSRHTGGFCSPLARAPSAPGPPASSGTDGWGVAGAQRSLPSQSRLTRGRREREGGRRGRLGPRGRQRARLPSAARACPGAGLGLAEARAGTGR